MCGGGAPAYWLPAGRLDAGESLAEAAQRECEEEAGVAVRPVGVLKLMVDCPEARTPLPPKSRMARMGRVSQRSAIVPSTHCEMPRQAPAVIRAALLVEPLADTATPKTAPILPVSRMRAGRNARAPPELGWITTENRHRSSAML